MRALLLAACLSIFATTAFAQELSLAGADGQAVTLTRAEFAALPRHSVVFEAHGTKGKFEGPLLIDILAKAGAPTGKQLHGAELTNAVLVIAADGYQVAFGLAEADPNTRANKIIIADRMDGKPLGDDDGPYRLVVEGDLRPARSVRQVVGLRVVKLGAGMGDGHKPH